MKCDFKIMASPFRYAYVMNMCKVLELNIEQDVFFDDRPNGGSAYYTSQRTWELPMDHDITHRCVLQDDLLLCHGFKGIIQKLVNAHPEAIWTLFSSRMNLAEIFERNKDTRVVKVEKCGIWGQAVIIPKQYLSDMYAWASDVAEKHGAVPYHDDVMYGEYALEHGIDVLTTMPGTVQHMCPTRSLLKLNNQKKVSKIFSIDADTYDWSNLEIGATFTCPNSMNFYKPKK